MPSKVEKRFLKAVRSSGLVAEDDLQRAVSIHELTYKAALTGDRDAAHQALLLDPQVDDFYDIEPMLRSFIKVLGEWLPDYWK